MSLHVRTVALDAADAQRLRLAIPLMDARGQRVCVSDWDGTRCGLAVVNADDAYGQKVRALACSRGVPVASVGRAPPSSGDDIVIASGAPVAHWVGVLNRAIAPPCAQEAAIALHGVGLLELATSVWRGKNIVATQGTRRVTIWGTRGRVCAQSLSDLMSATDRFATPGWTFEPVSGGEAPGHVSTSLDAFAFLAAWRHRNALPLFRTAPGRLRAWPDLATVKESMLALKLAGALRRASHTVDSLRAQIKSGAERELNACLWAFQAANLLTDPFVPYESKSPPQRSTPAPTTLIARLAARFGLSWGTA